MITLDSVFEVGFKVRDILAGKPVYGLPSNKLKFNLLSLCHVIW